MSQLDWEWPLDAGEMLLWQGRPAPRCYTFRHWKQVAIATVIFLVSSFWWMLAYQLFESDGYPWWLLLIPAPLVLGALFLGPANLLLARLRWEKEFYALTDKRLLIRNGLSPRINSFSVDDMLNWQQKRYGEHLASLRIEMRNDPPVVLHCLEQPQILTRHLPCNEKKPVPTGNSV